MASLISSSDILRDEQAEARRMQWLLNAATRTKLMLGFGLMILFLLGAILAAYYGLAMENINQAGSQNAASTRQAEAIARDLHGLSQRPKQLIEQYQV
jgi:hypothetical protein